MTFSEFFTENYRTESVDEDFEIEPPGAVSEIIKVIFKTTEHFSHRIGIAVVESGIRSSARSYLIQIGISVVIFEDLVYVEFSFWARTYKGHVALENIIELRYFIEMMSAQEASDLCQARVIVSSAMAELRAHLFGIQTHCAELIDFERSSEAAYAFLFENSRAFVLMLDCDCAYRPHRREDQKGDA